MKQEITCKKLYIYLIDCWIVWGNYFYGPYKKEEDIEISLDDYVLDFSLV